MLLTALGLLVVSRHFFDDRVGIVAVAIFVTVPLVKRLAGTGLVDVVPGPYVLAALVAFEYWRQRQHWQWIALCGALCVVRYLADWRSAKGVYRLALCGALCVVRYWQLANYRAYQSHRKRRAKWDRSPPQKSLCSIRGNISFRA